MKNVLILGGAGFIGSNIASKFSKYANVVVIDGLVERTGGNLENISNLKNITFIGKSIEDLSNFSNIVKNQDIIIDSMGWTSHVDAIENPELDLKLNLKSHLFLMECLKNNFKKNGIIFYLGSIGQYGLNQSKYIDESAQMLPIDVQGVNKLAAENYFRVYSNLYQINIVSLRIPNCYGENQQVEGTDIGLVGGFIKSAILKKNIVVFDKKRTRNIVYVKDLVDLIYQISKTKITSFHEFNVPSENIAIENLAYSIANKIDGCKVLFKEIPEKIKKIDSSGYRLNCEKLLNKVSYSGPSNLELSLEKTIGFFKDRIQ